jgi:hypothetical protein
MIKPMRAILVKIALTGKFLINIFNHLGRKFVKKIWLLDLYFYKIFGEGYRLNAQICSDLEF